MTIRAIGAVVSLTAAWTAAAGDQAAFFKERIEPILVGKCLSCHGADAKGGLDMRALAGLVEGGESGPALIASDADASLLLSRVAAGEMPPKHPLQDEEVAAIRQWIADGAFFPETPLDPFAATTEARAGYDWWAFQPVAAPEPPPVDLDWAHWSVRSIDRFVWGKLNENNLEPNREADPVTLIRRATYDLTGLPPTPEEIDAFVESCRSERGDDAVGNAAYLALIDRLLASPAYGEYWGRHWLDVIRYGESTGYEVNAIIDNVWPFRDYVIKSFNEDKPFDRFIQEHLAGDALAPGDPSVEVGLTFLVAGPHDIVGNQDAVQAAQIRADTVDEMIRASTEAFLGLTVGCARCHDHKFDAISQADYYRFYATFAGVHHGARPIVTEEERKSWEAALAPLAAKRDEANAAYTALEEAVLTRAEDKADAYEAKWPRPPIARSLTEESFPPVEARYLRLVAEGRDTDVYARAGHRIDEFEVWRAGSDAVNVALAANGGKAEGRSRQAKDFAGAYQADAVNDGKFGETWPAEGPELTIAFAQPETIDRVTFSSDRPNALGAAGEAVFLSEYRIEVSMDGETWREIANSFDRKPVNDAHRRRRLLDGELTEAERTRLTALNDERRAAQQAVDAVPRFTDYFVGNYRQPEGPTPIFLGGDPQRLGDEVVPASMIAASKSGAGYALAADAPERERRLALANWIADPRNPLTARVLANRVWHYHFGTGLVATPSDFGFMGAPPSHPELLDWLARELTAPTWNPDFNDEGDQAWRLKRLHRLIMMSMTYRQSSTYREDAARIDADSRLLWRYPPRRLTGEAIRDTMLSVAGVLETSRGGPGFRLYQYLRDNVATYVPLDEHGPETYRRAVYHQSVRAARIDLMTDFDSPDCALPTPRRDSTTSPLQALTLMNHDFTLDMSAALAERLRNDAGDDPAAQTARAFHLAFGRAPSTDETAEALALIDAHGLRAFCRAILNANELIHLN